MIGLFNKKNNLVGLDISSSSIKLLELSKRNDKIHVESYGVLPLQSGAVVEGEISNVEQIGEVILRLLSLSKSTANDVAVALLDASVIKKTVEMDASLSDYDLEQQVHYEAPSYMPFNNEAMALDFSVIGESDNDENLVKVLIAACRQSSVDMVHSAIESGGGECKIIDLESYCIERAFSELILKQLPSENITDIVALIDIGAENMNFRIMLGGKIIYQQDFNYGGKKLTEEIQKRYGMAESDAGKAKKHPDTLPDDYVPVVLKEFNRQVCSNIIQSIQSFFSSRQHKSVDYIVLSGGAAMTMNLKDEVETKIDIPTFIANPFEHTSMDSRVDKNKLENDASAMLIACGLALRGVE